MGDEILILTECETHGIETVAAPRVALALPDGSDVISISYDPEVGGWLVTAPEGPLGVGAYTLDGRAVEGALVLFTKGGKPRAAQVAPGGSKLN